MIRLITYTAIIVAVSDSTKEYRSDYEYNLKTDSFYKLHIETVTYNQAIEICNREGAQLITASPRDVVQAHGMLKQFPDIQDYVWSFNDGLPHDSVEYEEISLESLMNGQYMTSAKNCEVITRMGEVRKVSCASAYRPFICKVQAIDAVYNPQCNVYSKGYRYLESVGSCYKVSSVEVTWNQALAECEADRAHLLILNSDLERQVVLNHSRPFNVGNRHSLPWYYAGIRAEKTKDGSPLIYKTIFGQTLDEAGYNEWCDGEPNNWGGDETCGTISKTNGKYNDVACYHTIQFICEKEVNVTQSNN